MSDPIADLLAAQAQSKQAEPVDPVQALLQAQANPTLSPQQQRDQQAQQETKATIGRLGDLVYGAGMGAADLVQGAGQKVLHGALGAYDTLASGDQNPSGPARDWLQRQSNALDQAISQREAQYQADTLGSFAAGLGRVSANVAPFLAGGEAAQVPRAQNLLSKVLLSIPKGATQGAALSATQPIDMSNQDGGDFGSAVTRQVGAGALAGGALAPVGQVIADKLALPVANKGLAWYRGQSGTAPTADIAGVAHNLGLDIGYINPDIQAATQKEVQSALNAGEVPDVNAAVRKMKFQQAGIEPMVGQITRDPAQYTAEQNLRSLPGGQPVMTRLNEQNKALVNALHGSGAAEASTPYVAGKSLASDLVAGDTARGQAVDQAYQAMRDSAGRYVDFNRPAYVNAVNDALDAQQAGSSLPESARKMLNGIATGQQTIDGRTVDIPFNANTITQFDKQLTRIKNGADDAGKYAVNLMQKALADAQPVDSAGADTMALYQKAKGLAAQRFNLIDQNPALQAALNGAAPEDLIHKYVVNGDIDKVNSLMNLVSPETRETVKNQVAAHLFNKATNAAPLEDANWSNAGFARAMNQIPLEIQQAIFPPGQLANLQNLKDVSGYIYNNPAGSAVNHSNTGGALGTVLSKMGKIPYLNYVAGPLESLNNGLRAGTATAAQIPSQPGPTNQALANALMRAFVSPAVPLAQDRDKRRQ